LSGLPATGSPLHQAGQRALNWLDAGIGRKGLSGSETLRLRITLVIIRLSALFSLAFTGLAWQAGRTTNAAVFGISGIALLGACVAMRFDRARLARNLTAWLVAAQLLIGMASSGGPDSGAVAWVTVCVALFALVLAPMEALVATVGCMLGVAATVVLEVNGQLPVVERAPSDVYADVGGASLAFILLTLAFATVRHQARREVEESLARLEDEVQRRRLAEEEARSAEHLKSRFLATMSHEIRTPLNGVVGIADLLAETDLDAHQLDLLDTARRSGGHLLRVINDTLDLSRIQAGGLRLVDGVFSPEACARDAVRLVSQDPRHIDVDITLSCGSGLPRWVRGDEDRVRQILLNLIGNAAKFTGIGEVQVELAGQGQGSVRFRVVDSGPGIGPGDLQRIFTPFDQGDGELGRQKGGTGLGLAIVKGLVDAMNGVVNARSELGRGATFDVVLPLPSSLQPELAVDASVTPRNLDRVLVVEDNPTNAFVLGRMLDHLGIVWELAEHGAHALKRMENGDYGLILMDCEMPVVDGFEATRQLRAQGVDLPIIGVTANAMPEDQARCIEAGMSDYLPKPVRLPDLERCLARWSQRPPLVDGAARRA